MTVRSETVAALAQVLDKNEREALLWAAQIGADTADSVSGLMAPAGEQVRAVGRSLRALLPTLRDAAAAVYDGPPPPTAGPALMGDSGHFAEVCSTHGDVLTQCRCDAPDKERRPVPCPGRGCPGFHRPNAAPRPGRCSACGMSIAKCDTRIRNRRPACCTQCSITDTHGDTPSGYADRERARAEILAAATGEVADDKTVVDRAIARGTLRPRGS